MRRIAVALVLGLTSLAGAAAGERLFKLRDAGGHEVFTIKREATGAKLVDPSEHELARFKPHGDRLKIEDAHDAFVGEVTGDATKLSLKGADKKVVFVLRRQDDGDYKLEDGHEALLLKLKRKGDAIRGEDAGGQTIFKVKNKHGKLELTDGKEQVKLSAEGSGSLMGFAVLGLERLDQIQRAALCYRLDELAVP